MRNAAPASAQILLPFAEREYVSTQRAARILGVRYRTLFELFERGLIEVVDYRRRARKRVKYSSIVALCDLLRAKYNIADRRPPLDHPMFRHRDEDLLPFPMADTITIAEAKDILGYAGPEAVRLMIHEGLFEGYKICEQSPWRISRSSLAAFVAKVQAKNHPPQALRQPRASELPSYNSSGVPERRGA